MEIEEKQRQIMEKQKRASVKRREKPGTDSNIIRHYPKEDTTPTPSESSETIDDLKEKRRSLLMMWESYAEGEGPGPENRQENEEKRRSSFGYDRMMTEAADSDVSVIAIVSVCMVNTQTTYKDKAPVFRIDRTNNIS